MYRLFLKWSLCARLLTNTIISLIMLVNIQTFNQFNKLDTDRKWCLFQAQMTVTDVVFGRYMPRWRSHVGKRCIILEIWMSTWEELTYGITVYKCPTVMWNNMRTDMTLTELFVSESTSTDQKIISGNCLQYVNHLTITLYYLLNSE